MNANKQKYNSLSKEEIAKKAREAFSNEDLAVICEQLNIADKIFLGKVDLWLAKHALSTIYRTLKKYPALRSNMNYFGTLNGFMQNKKELIKTNQTEIQKLLINESDKIVNKCLDMFKNDALAAAFLIKVDDNYLSGIIINGKSFNQQDIINELRNGEKTGFSPKGCNSVKSVIDHEIGHMLDQLLNINTAYQFKKLIRKYDLKYIDENLSHYSVLNNEINEAEVIAEAYSEYCNNPNPRDIAKTVGELIDNKYQIKFGKYSNGGE